MRFFAAFTTGLLIPLRALGLIVSTPRLLLWCCLPFALSVGVYILLWGQLLAPARTWVELASQGWLAGVLGQSQFSALGSAAQWIIHTVVTVLFFITMLISFAWVSNLAALPVNDFVAQATERALTPPLERPQSVGFWHEARLLWIDLKKSILSLVGLLICLSVGWVPIFNLFAIIIAWLLLTFQFVSYPQTRRAIGARQGMLSVIKNFPLTLGFGLSISLAFSLPILSVFVPPIAVVGGTIIFSKLR